MPSNNTQKRRSLKINILQTELHHFPINNIKIDMFWQTLLTPINNKSYKNKKNKKI